MSVYPSVDPDQAGRRTYTVHAKRWVRGWELHIDGVGVTQCRTFTEAEDMARDYIALALGLEADAFDVVIEAEGE
jgi:hypothetical protein